MPACFGTLAWGKAITLASFLAALTYAAAAKAEPAIPESCDEGRNAMQSADDDAAIRFYADCLSHDGLSEEMRFEAHYHSGETLMYVGRFEEAAEHFAEAVRLVPNFTAASFGLAVTLGQIGEYEEGVEVLDRYASRFTVENAEYYASLRGWLLNHSGRYEEAVTVLDEAVRLGTVDVAVYLNRANALASLGRFEESNADLDFALDLEPSNALIYSQYGGSLRTQGYQRQAIAKLDKALELDPQDAIALLERGRAKAELGDLDAAVEDFNRVTEIDPEEAWAYANRAQALVELGRAEQAMADLERALALSPTNINALVLRGQQLSVAGRYQDARRDFEAAVAADPLDSYLRQEHGGVLYQLGLWDESLAEYSRAAEIDPSNTDHIVQRGFLRLRLGMTNAALEDFNLAISNLPEVSHWYQYRAHALAWLGRRAEAAADVERAFALMAEEDKAWGNNNNCWDFLLQGETNLAEALCVQAAELLGVEHAHDSLAFYYWQQGRDDQAEAHLAKALALSGGDQFYNPKERLDAFSGVLARGLLMYLGFRPDDPDGAVTIKTRQAIEAFQRDKGLPVDGEVTAALLDALRAAKP